MDARPGQFQITTKETGGNRNVSSENAMNLIDCNESVFQDADTRSFKNRIRKHQTTFFDHVMRREKLEYPVTTGMINGKSKRGKQREKMLDRLTKWLKEGRVTEALKAMRDSDD